MWYEDKDLRSISIKCDKAQHNQDSSLLLELSEKCKKSGEDSKNSTMIRAYYYYNSFTSLSNYQRIIHQEIDNNEREELTEKVFFLCRSSINLMEKYLSENNLSNIEEGYFKRLYYQAKVNYCNLLVDISRYSKAIYNIKSIASEKFGMAIGNLGTEISDYAQLDYDDTHRHLLAEKACSLLKEALSFSDSHVHPSAKEFYKSRLISLLGREEFEDKFKSIPSPDFLLQRGTDFEFNSEHNSIKESEYQNWATANSLMLNTVNDIDTSLDFCHDSIHLPNMVISMEESNQTLHGLFNQIKQEYCSARYMLYEGIAGPRPHFSDNDVYLIDTLDYPMYGLNIERIKSAYRVLYSLFDRIAYFLDKYYKLENDLKKVSYSKVWRENSQLRVFAEKNRPLKALHWIKKDLYGNAISDYKEHIDPILHKTYNIRQSMEHRYLKVLDSAFVEKTEESENDLLAEVITYDEFYDLAINLLRTCREAIILLCMSVNVEEKKKLQQLDGEKIPPLSLFPYRDDWKS